MPAVALTAGIVVGNRWGVTATWWMVLFVAIVTTVVLWRWPATQSAALLLAVAALGALRAATVSERHHRVTWPDGYVSYEAVIVGETAEKAKTIAADIILARDGRKVKCYIAKDSASRRLQVGDRLRLQSRITNNSDWRRGTFDYRRYLEINGFAGQAFVSADDWQLLSSPDGNVRSSAAQPTGSDSNAWQGLSLWQRTKLRFMTARHRLLQRYRQTGAADDEYAVVAAMTLGDKSAMTQELKEVYSVSGASHVLALSGLHLGIIYAVLSILVVSRRLRGVAQGLIVIAIWAFALLVGLPTSVVRAAVMISVFALLSLAHRNRMSLNALALAALLILIVSPDSLFDVGFQMSFCAMLAILLLQPPLEGLVSQQFLLDHPLLRWAWGLATVSVAAQVGVAPLIAYYFGRFATYFLITNFIVIPAATVVLALAMATLLIPAVGSLLVAVVKGLNASLGYIATTLPHASIEGLHPTALQVALTYVVILSVYLIIKIYAKHA